MNVGVQKTGERDGKERFVLVNAKTGEAITTKDVSEPTMRKFLKRYGHGEDLIEECFSKARRRYLNAQAKESAAVQDEEDFDLFLSDMGIEDE